MMIVSTNHEVLIIPNPQFLMTNLKGIDQSQSSDFTSSTSEGRITYHQNDDVIICDRPHFGGGLKRGNRGTRGIAECQTFSKIYCTNTKTRKYYKTEF